MIQNNKQGEDRVRRERCEEAQRQYIAGEGEGERTRRGKPKSKPEETTYG